MLESTLRTTNNLLERLHASYFFYLLTGPGTFVQIGKYLTAAVLVGIGMELEGLKAWVDSGWGLEEEEFEKPTTPPHGDTKSTVITPPVSAPRVRRQAWRRRRRPVLQALALMIGTHLFGWLAFVLITSPLFVRRLQVSLKLTLANCHLVLISTSDREIHHPSPGQSQLVSRLCHSSHYLTLICDNAFAHHPKRRLLQSFYIHSPFASQG